MAKLKGLESFSKTVKNIPWASKIAISLKKVQELKNKNDPPSQVFQTIANIVSKEVNTRPGSDSEVIIEKLLYMLAQYHASFKKPIAEYESCVLLLFKKFIHIYAEKLWEDGSYTDTVTKIKNVIVSMPVHKMLSAEAKKSWITKLLESLKLLSQSQASSAVDSTRKESRDEETTASSLDSDRRKRSLSSCENQENTKKKKREDKSAIKETSGNDNTITNTKETVAESSKTKWKKKKKKSQWNEETIPDSQDSEARGVLESSLLEESLEVVFGRNDTGKKKKKKKAKKVTSPLSEKAVPDSKGSEENVKKKTELKNLMLQEPLQDSHRNESASPQFDAQNVTNPSSDEPTAKNYEENSLPDPVNENEVLQQVANLGPEHEVDEDPPNRQNRAEMRRIEDTDPESGYEDDIFSTFPEDHDEFDDLPKDSSGENSIRDTQASNPSQPADEIAVPSPEEKSTPMNPAGTIEEPTIEKGEVFSSSDAAIQYSPDQQATEQAGPENTDESKTLSCGTLLDQLIQQSTDSDTPPGASQDPSLIDHQLTDTDIEILNVMETIYYETDEASSEEELNWDVVTVASPEPKSSPEIRRSLRLKTKSDGESPTLPARPKRAPRARPKTQKNLPVVPLSSSTVPVSWTMVLERYLPPCWVKKLRGEQPDTFCAPEPHDHLIHLPCVGGETCGMTEHAHTVRLPCTCYHTNGYTYLVTETPCSSSLAQEDIVSPSVDEEDSPKLIVGRTFRKK